MSAPAAMPTPVSRLPKFGSWSKSSSPAPGAASQTFPAARLPNGFYHHPGPAPADGPAPAARRVGTLRTPAEYAAKWRKNHQVTDGGHPDGAGHPQRSFADAKAEAASLPVPKSGLPVPRSGLPVPKNKLAISKSSLSGSKRNLDGLSGSKLRPPQRSAHPSGALSCSGPGPPADRSRSAGKLGSRPPKGGLALRRRASPPAAPASPAPSHKGSGTSRVPGGVNKSLLPALKANGVSYKLSRPWLAKRAPSAQTWARTASSAGSGPERACESPASPPEDASPSSGSSAERARHRQGYTDDFERPGSGGAAVYSLPLAKNEEEDSGLDRSCGGPAAGNGLTVTTELDFLDNALDWTHAGDDEASKFSRRSRSSPSDYHERGGSSLDLSPSDSFGSGGIYMWDEEGLEPLGAESPRLGSFDSDVDSSDVLTNVDSCDLDEDDLMLDADFPDDVSFHADGDGTPRMAEWRRRQLCWGTQDVHDDDREVALYDEQDRSHVDGDLALDLSPQRTPPADVDELAGDFGALRSQLELLRSFLLQDADDAAPTTHTLSPEDGDRSRVEAEVEVLVREVQQLKRELRSKENIISQLGLQLAAALESGRCPLPTDGPQRGERHAQTGAAEGAGRSVASQTPRRERAAFPPAAFLSPPWQYQRSRPYGGRSKPSIPSHLARKTTGILAPPARRAEATSGPPGERKLRPPAGSAHPAPPRWPRLSGSVVPASSRAGRAERFPACDGKTGGAA